MTGITAEYSSKSHGLGARRLSNPYVEDFFMDVEWEEGICCLPMSKLARWNRMQPSTPTPSLECQVVGNCLQCREIIFCSFEPLRFLRTSKCRTNLHAPVCYYCDTKKISAFKVVLLTIFWRFRVALPLKLPQPQDSADQDCMQLLHPHST